MAYDEGLVQILRDQLAGCSGLVEKKMFGGLCFMHRGHMLCGIHSKNGDGGMFRVGPAQYEEALKIEGVEDMAFTGRPMKGFVEVQAEFYEDEARLNQLLDMALSFTNSLAPK